MRARGGCSGHLCLSKGLTAGICRLRPPSSRSEIYEAFLSEDRSRTFFHGHSFTANPLACAVALASLDIFRDEPVLDRVVRLERQLRDGLAPLRALSVVGEVRVIGGVGVVELVSNKVTREAGGYLDDVGPTLAAAFLDRGLLLRPLGNTLYFMPPYVITDDEVSWALEQIADVLSTRVQPATR